MYMGLADIRSSLIFMVVYRAPRDEIRTLWEKVH